MSKKPVQTLLLIVLLTILYFAAGSLGVQLAIVHPQASAVWPASGLALAACLLFGFRVWPGIFLAAFLVNFSISDNLFTASAIALGNTLEALVGTYLVNRFANGRQVFRRSFDVFKFVLLVCFISTTMSATIGVSSLALANLAEGQNYLSIWWNGGSGKSECRDFSGADFYGYRCPEWLGIGNRGG
jgi:integral membrane sensor domain MASE1